MKSDWQNFKAVLFSLTAREASISNFKVIFTPGSLENCAPFDFTERKTDGASDVAGNVHGFAHVQQIGHGKIVDRSFSVELRFEQRDRFLGDEVEVLLHRRNRGLDHLRHVRHLPGDKGHSARNFDLAEIQRVPDSQSCGFPVGDDAGDPPAILTF